MLGVPVARRVLASAGVLVVLAWAPGAAGAAGRYGSSEGDQIVLSGTVAVPRGVSVGEVVVLHGRAVIQGVARGDVVVVDGPIVVQGQVSGSVVAVNGTVSLGPDAQVRGDVMASGDVTVEEGARVSGTVRQHTSFTFREPLRAVGRLLTWLAVSVSTLLLAFVLVLLVPRGADAVFEAVRTAPWASLGWGFVLALGIPVVSIALLVTLLGLPLGLLVLLALAFLYTLGYLWTAWIVGRLLWRPPRNRPLAFLIGWAILRALALIPYVGTATWVAGAVYGLGSTSVATWRTRAVGGKHREGRAARALAESEQMKEEMGL
jgi:cytoskeletal protein CcmA (bactofilin family)